MKYWQKKGIVSRETLPPNSLSFLIRARMDNQIRNSENATTPNARLNLRRKAAGFILRMFQLHIWRSSAVGSMFKLVRIESEGTRGDRSMFRLQDRASPESSEALSYKNPIIPHRTPPAADNSRPKFTPNS